MVFQRLQPDILPPADAVSARHQLLLDPVPRAARRARRFVEQHAGDLPADSRDILLLLTSELVSNAVIHARTPIELELVLARESVVVTVHDLALAGPAQQPYGSREGGWGLSLVAALAESWSVTEHAADGKTAWFRLLRHPAAVPDGAAARPRPDGRSQ